jgi:Mg-chelatase subunit ChlD
MTSRTTMFLVALLCVAIAGPVGCGDETRKPLLGDGRDASLPPRAVVTEESPATEEPAPSQPATSVPSARDAAVAMMPETAPGAADSGSAPPSPSEPAGCTYIDLHAHTRTELKPGIVLVVFDRSGSMQADWNGQPKYQAAGNALVAALTPLQDYLTVGGIFFPSPGLETRPPPNACPTGCDPRNLDHWRVDGAACCLNIAEGCTVNGIEQPDQINFSPAVGFSANISRHWLIDDPMAVNGTPLETGIDRAAQAISSRTFSDPLLVLVLTDSPPNCGTSKGHVVDQVTAFHNAGIPTYVVGLPGAEPALRTLDAIAKAGGTEETIVPTDPQNLADRLAYVVSSTVHTGFDTCIFHLEPAPSAADQLHVIVTAQGADRDVPSKLSDTAHWSLNAAGNEVTLEDQLCRMATGGSFEAIRFVSGCIDGVAKLDPPPPPPPPIMPN